MACTSALIPEYLHWNNREIFDSNQFQNEHRLYRLGNPIAFPNTTTAFSCKWSFLINEEDVLFSNDPPISDDYRYAIVESLKQFQLQRENAENDVLKWHKLSCVLKHFPAECDYSHCEVLIRHQAWNDEQEVLFDQTYTYEMWQTGELLLQGKGFYKILRKDYRKEIIQLFNFR